MSFFFFFLSVHAQEQQKLLSFKDVSMKKLKEVIDGNDETISKQRGEINSLQNEKDRLVSETVNLNTQMQNYMEEKKLKELELFDCKKRITNSEAKTKLQMTMYDQVSRLFCLSGFPENRDARCESLKIISRKFFHVKANVVGRN